MNKLKNRLALMPRFPLIFQSGLILLVVGLAFLTRPWAVPTEAAVITGGQSLGIWNFLAAFAAATVLVLLLLRWRFGSKAFSALFMLAVFLGAAAIGFAFAGDVGAVLTFSGAVALHYLIKRVWSFNLVLVVGLAGVCLNLGQAMAPMAAAIILVILSFYDLMAVYGTRHMVRMAKRLAEDGGLFAAVVPLRPAGLLERIAQVEPKKGFFFLGTGDLILPGIMAVSASRLGLGFGVAVLFGALIGLTVNLVIFFTQTKPKPMPALPAPAAGSILAFLLVSLIS